MLVSQFLKYILPDVPGCPNAMAQTELLRAAQELCTKALVWDEWQDPVALEAGVNQIELTAPSGAEVCNIKAVNCGPSCPLEPKDDDEIRRLMPDWQTAQANLPVYYNCARDWDSLWIYPIPNDPTVQLYIQAVYRPLMTATQLPDWFTSEFRDALVAGAKARLMKMRNQQWSEPQLAQAYRAEFDAAVADARIQAEHGKVQGNLTVAPRRFGRY
jgi:hypothetical protein